MSAHAFGNYPQRPQCDLGCTSGTPERQVSHEGVLVPADDGVHHWQLHVLYEVRVGSIIARTFGVHIVG